MPDPCSPTPTSRASYFCTIGSSSLLSHPFAASVFPVQPTTPALFPIPSFFSKDSNDLPFFAICSLHCFFLLLFDVLLWFFVFSYFFRFVVFGLVWDVCCACRIRCDGRALHCLSHLPYHTITPGDEITHPRGVNFRPGLVQNAGGTRNENGDVGNISSRRLHI